MIRVLLLMLIPFEIFSQARTVDTIFISRGNDTICGNVFLIDNITNDSIFYHRDTVNYTLFNFNNLINHSKRKITYYYYLDIDSLEDSEKVEIFTKNDILIFEKQGYGSKVIFHDQIFIDESLDYGEEFSVKLVNKNINKVKFLIYFDYVGAFQPIIVGLPILTINCKESISILGAMGLNFCFTNFRNIKKIKNYSDIYKTDKGYMLIENDIKFYKEFEKVLKKYYDVKYENMKF
jgi:hypothetical protein